MLWLCKALFCIKKVIKIARELCIYLKYKTGNLQFIYLKDGHYVLCSRLYACRCLATANMSNSQQQADVPDQLSPPFVIRSVKTPRYGCKISQERADGCQPNLVAARQCCFSCDFSVSVMDFKKNK